MKNRPKLISECLNKIKIYVVYGEESDYSGYNKWTVKAFTDEDAAKQFVELVNQEVSIIEQMIENGDAQLDRQSIQKALINMIQIYMILGQRTIMKN